MGPTLHFAASEGPRAQASLVELTERYGQVPAEAADVIVEAEYHTPAQEHAYLQPEAGLAYTEELIAAWRDDPLITIAVEPHSPYLCAPDLLRRAGAMVCSCAASVCPGNSIISAWRIRPSSSRSSLAYARQPLH